MHRSAKVRNVCAITVAGLLLALLYHGFVGHILGAGYPSNTFLFEPGVRFTDYFDVFNPVQQGHPLSNEWCPYFPFAYVPVYALVWLTPVRALAVTVCLFLACVFWFFWKKLDFLALSHRLLATAVLAFATYPVIFCIDRGNLEMIVLIFMLGFFATFECGNYLLAAVFLACATAMKLHPGVFCVLFLLKREYKACALTALLTLVLTLVSAASFPGGLFNTFELTVRNIRFFTEHMVLGRQSMPFSSGYFSVLKILILALGGDITQVAQQLRPAYVLFTFVVFAGVAAYILKFERTTWKQVSLLVFALIVLPDVSFDYKLIYVLAPLGMFIAAPAGRPREDLVYTILFGLLVIPKAYATIGQVTTAGVVVNPLLMTAIAGLIIHTGIRSSRDRATGAPAH